MATDRRNFIKKTAMALAAIPVLSSPLRLLADDTNNQNKMKKIMLIDGGLRRGQAHGRADRAITSLSLDPTLL